MAGRAAPSLEDLDLEGLAKKDRATVYIQFANGQMHQRTIKGNFAVRSAHGEAMQVQAPAEQATADVLWFYFGYSSYFTLTDENGWPLAEAEKWLLAQASSVLLS
jgi:hypothetical protein